MAKKTKTTTIVEEDPQEIDYKKDIEGKDFQQVAEAPKEEPKEEVKETPKEEETETVEFDPEQLKREAVEMAKKELADQLQGDTKKETEENVDEYQKYQEKFFKENNRQPTWFEVAKFTEDRNFAKLEAKQTEQAKAAEEEKTKQQEAVNKNNEETNKYIDTTFSDLYENDKLPPVQDPKNNDDYGLKVKNALLAKVVEVNTKLIAENKTPKTLKEVFYEDFEQPRKEVPGANAPTNMGRGGYTPDETQEMDYREIHGPRNSFKSIISNAVKKSS